MLFYNVIILCSNTVMVIATIFSWDQLRFDVMRLYHVIMVCFDVMGSCYRLTV